MADNPSEPTRSPTSSGATTKLFQANKPPPSALPAVLEFIEALAGRFSSGLRQLTSLDPSFVLESLTRGNASEVQFADVAVVRASAFVPPWNARILITYDRLLVVRFVEAMFGGNPARPLTAPNRALTGFETALVMNLTETILNEIKDAVIGYCDISFADVDCPDGVTGPSPLDGSADAVVARLRNPEFGDSLWIALPAIGLDLITDRTSTNEPDDAPGLDPRWTRQLRRALGGTPMSLVAVAHAPSISIGDVAALRPGSRLEFDGECFNHVRLECSDQVLLVGRLGQSKGRYTLCVESMASTPTARDGE